MRSRPLRAITGSIAVVLATLTALPVQAQSPVRIRVGWPSTTVSAPAAPFAVAMKLGWFRDDGADVDLVPLAGSVDCVKNVATRAVDFALASVEPLAAARLQGLRAKTFYSAHQGNTFSIAVPADSAVRTVADLKGKTIGVISMGSNGVLVARALAAAHGLDPTRDITLAVVGQAAQAAAMLRNRQVDAVSQADVQHAIVERAGMKLRRLPSDEISRFPSDGFIALEETLKTRRKAAVALARGYAKATVFTIANPEAAIRILHELYPATSSTGIDPEQAVASDVKVLLVRIENWRLERSGAKRWGENSEANYASYVDFLMKWGILQQKVDARDLVTYELIDEINRFDAAKVSAAARAFTK